MFMYGSLFSYFVLYYAVAYIGTSTTCNTVDHGRQKYMQCEHGCCGNDPNDQYCCDANDNDNDNQ